MKISDLKDYSKEDLLALFGVEPKRTTTDALIPAAGMFAMGMLVGAGLGLLFAPKKGAELRTDVSKKIGEIRERVPEIIEEVSV